MKSEKLAGTGWKVSKYRPEFCEIAYDVLRRGATYAQLAQRLGTSRGVVNGWRKAHPDFAQACEMGRDHGIADKEDLLEEAIFMGKKINVPLFKFLFKTRFGIGAGHQEKLTPAYTPISLRELYAQKAP